METGFSRFFTVFVMTYSADDRIAVTLFDCQYQYS